MLRRLRSKILDADRNLKRLVLAFWDAAVASFALWLALYLRFGSTTYPHDERYGVLYAALPLVVVGALWGLGVYRLLLRSMDSTVVLMIATGAAAGSVLIMVYDFYETTMFIPRSVPFIFWLLAFAGIGAFRLALKALYSLLVPRGPARRRIAIVGDGDDGVELASALRHARGYRVVALFDTSGNLSRTTVGGVRVHGLADMVRVVEQMDVVEVLVADRTILSQEGETFARLVADAGVSIRLAPSIDEVLSQDSAQLRTPRVRIEDLVGREIRPPIEGLVERSTDGRTVLVTGAAGSIGSEICRQVLAAGAARLVAFDNNEFGLYALDQELRPLLRGEVTLDIRLGSVTDEDRVRAVFAEAEPTLAYHAAAYKHVPMVEANPLAAVRNNVMGTRTVAEAAVEAGVERFVLISTDKAVRPTNVMGATKRLSELVVQDLQRTGSATAGEDGAAQCGSTILSMVRFGNVLGSSGSVVPLFQRQIDRGGPVTLTNRQVTRYFMTIEEAAQLVLQAGFLARGGEVFVLDMGEPVRLHDLARMMIQLSGQRVQQQPGDGGIEIRETGLRPGEKMYEELLIGGDVVGTEHPKIMRAMERRLESAELRAVLEELDEALSQNDPQRAIALLERHGDLNRVSKAP